MNMAKSAKKPRVLARVTVPATVEIRQPEFERLSSLAALDLKRLSKGNHKIEIGFVKGGCCRNLVRAVIRDGLVVGCEAEPCKESRQGTPPELMKAFSQAHAKLTRGKKWKPIPVAELVRSSAAMEGLIIWGGGCILICAWGYCFMCCWWPRPHCFIPDIYTGPLN
jgi:hypothetical protein